MYGYTSFCFLATIATSLTLFLACVSFYVFEFIVVLVFLWFVFGFFFVFF